MSEVPSTKGGVLMEFNDAVRELRRPFALEAVGFKLQALMPKNDPKRGQIVSYIDARLAAERLTHVVGGDWADEYRSTPINAPGALECRLTVATVTRADVGFTSDVTSDVGIKTLYSDSFKRAAVKFGVGVSLYALPRVVVPVEQLTNWGGKFHLFDNSPAMKVARDSYQAWVTGPGGEAFGDVLSHGDAEAAQGDIELGTTEDAPEPVNGAQTPAQGLPERYVDCLRLAIRSRDNTELVDDAEWASLVGAATTNPQKKALVDGLEAKLRDLDMDPSLVRSRWEASRVKAGS